MQTFRPACQPDRDGSPSLVHRLPGNPAWSLGRAENWIVVASVVWIALEFVVLRDSSLAVGWLFVLVAFAIGGVYIVIRRIVRGPLPPLGAPHEELPAAKTPQRV